MLVLIVLKERISLFICLSLYFYLDLKVDMTVWTSKDLVDWTLLTQVNNGVCHLSKKK